MIGSIYDTEWWTMQRGIVAERVAERRRADWRSIYYRLRQRREFLESVADGSYRGNERAVPLPYARPVPLEETHPELGLVEPDCSCCGQPYTPGQPGACCGA